MQLFSNYQIHPAAKLAKELQVIVRRIEDIRPLDKLLHYSERVDYIPKKQVAWSDESRATLKANSLSKSYYSIAAKAAAILGAVWILWLCSKFIFFYLYPTFSF